MTELQKILFEMQDPEYRKFQCRLMPTVDPETVIGVRTPLLRSLAKQLAKERDMTDFLKELPHTYYEENNLHAFLLEGMKDYEACIAELDRFLPYVNNWATCDLMTPKVFRKHLSELEGKIRQWLASKDTYTVRFGLGMLQSFYLEDAFLPSYVELAASVQSEEYYVKMMQAWYFATALAKQYHSVLPYLEQRRLEPWTHNKSIQKALESYRISPEQKAYLKTLKIKKQEGHL